MEAAEQHRQQLRSLRDFLLVYNRMTELCFRHCVCNLNYRLLTTREESCLDACAGRLVRANHRLMGSYVGLMPAIIQRRSTYYEDSTAQAASPVGESVASAASPDPSATPQPARPAPGAPAMGR